MLEAISWILVVLIFLLLANNSRNKMLEEKFSKDSAQENNLNSCQVPSLNTSQCYKSRYYENYKHQGYNRRELEASFRLADLRSH